MVYALSAYPIGRLACRLSRKHLLAAGAGVLLSSQLVLMLNSRAGGFIGVALWGLQMGMTQGLLSALVADSCPADLRGTAFGLFNLVGGFAALGASAIAGAIWTGFGPEATFAAGAGITLLTLIAMRVLPESG